MQREIDRLKALFERLGARDPESWARSEVEEDIPQLATFLFLRAAWREVVDAEGQWVAQVTERRPEPDGPLGDVPAALRRLLAQGASSDDLTTLVRGLQYELLFGLCYLLADPNSGRDEASTGLPALDEVGWGLFELDAEGAPQRAMCGAHESVLGMDPTGREMRPRT